MTFRRFERGGWMLAIGPIKLHWFGLVRELVLATPTSTRRLAIKL